MQPGSRLLRVENLVKYFPVGRGILSRLTGSKAVYVHAVDGVSFHLDSNETLAIVGESGSGKTTMALAIINLIPATSGKVFFEDRLLSELTGAEMRKIRSNMQIVFQDPSSSLDPRRKVGDSIAEPLRAAGVKDKIEMNRRVSESMNEVGLDDTQTPLLPHMLSGGQRQRVSIARAIINKPRLVILDEPTSALDASVQSQILLLLQKLQSEHHQAYLLITHNMSVAKYLADRIGVMYLGKLAEMGRNQDVIEKPSHPYTQLLLSAVLEPTTGTRLPETQSGDEIPNPSNPPKGCRFNTRCPYAKSNCFDEEPRLRAIKYDHYAACHFAEEISKGKMVPNN